MDFIRKESAHSTAIVDIGDYLVISLRGGGGGVANMADGVIVGNISVISKETLENMLSEYQGTLIVVSHDRYFINKVADKLLVFENRYLR